jgi:hypothetical protein
LLDQIISVYVRIPWRIPWSREKFFKILYYKKLFILLIKYLQVMKYLMYSFVPILLGTLVSAFILPSFAQQMDNPELAQKLKNSPPFKDALEAAGNVSLQETQVITILCPPGVDIGAGIEGCSIFMGFNVS